jgi:putative phage-type endonuclease
VSAPYTPAAEVLTSTKGLTRADWLAIRRQGIGGSDAAAIAGLDRWSSPLGVYYDKIGELADSEDTEAMAWGRRLEPVLAAEFALRTGFKVWKRNAILRSREHPFMLANLDGLVRDDNGRVGPVEYKTSTERGAAAWRADEDELPDRVYCQVQHYLAVTGCTFAWVAALLAGTEYRMVRVERDDVAIAALVDLEDHFWDRVRTRNPPEADGSDATRRALTEVFKDSYPAAVELPDDYGRLLEEWNALKGLEAGYKARREVIENRFRQFLGEAEEGVLDGRTVVTWRSSLRTRVDVTALREKDPELAAQYEVTEPQRRLLVKAPS